MKTEMKERYNEYIEKFKATAPGDVQEKMKQAIQELEQSSDGKGLSEGEKAPNFNLPDAKGNSIELYKQLEEGPVILTFYRGGWCPYCNMELRAYQEILGDIHDSGGELIAISPEQPDHSLSTAEKNDLQFHVVSDVGNETANQYNLVYQLPDYLVEVYKEKGLRVDEHNGDEAWTLPVSTTYVIDQDGTIVYEYTKEDYKDRAEPSEVLKQLKKVRV
ncbi:alkyl hydroperoxide reductase [Halobacillus halophilus]|uniref:thioredoxin-dependent peroxiredoxin n=1 Tax=Halobacillus halophilus (strain ATCC 35676 / DSM 2266 / JCM 20832 / KCTC 3685 / LMG 17431 / NBRC 102448 / NCIMB 2269) TaxID=866895 RepID=I0JJ27_HALH3|nr:peroxiredoxin-like family protein [Halobacillus halophilus]ASF38311.1 alkyl hydroperoxide reductase [Halobacillus halophilus]CCG44145.1 redoxin [Halobacillus halophilus DSM 2266]